MTISKSAALLAASMLGLAACDQSPQHADGATATNDPGVAAAITNGAIADTGSDTGTGGDIGGAGEATAGDEAANSNTVTNTPSP